MHDNTLGELSQDQGACLCTLSEWHVLQTSAHISKALMQYVSM